MNLRSWAPLVLLPACAYTSPADYFVFPPGTEVRIVDTAPFIPAWRDAGMADPAGCPTVHEAVVSTEFMEKVCGMPSCYRPTVTLPCVWACARYLTEMPTALWARPALERPGHSELDELRHETYHAWIACLYDASGDPAHTLSVWHSTK